MALLNFKYGLHKNLPAFSNDTIGNVFVTTDEQAMHIDLPGGRVVISQIITLATAQDWQNMKPPYSTQAFYYIVDANALLKYTGNGTTHSWKQINSTADVQSAIDSLTTIIGTKDDEGNWTEGSLGATVAGHSTEITSIKSNIENLQKADTTFSESLQNIANDVTAVETLVSTLESVVGYAGAFDTEAAALADGGVEAGEVCLVGGVIKLCTADSQNVKSLTDYRTVIAEIEALKKAIDELDDSVASNTTVTDLQNRVKALEDWKALLVVEIGTPTNSDTAATGMYALIEAAQAQADLAKSTADQAVTDAKKANDAIGNDGTDGNAKTGLHAAIEKNTTDITNLQSELNSDSGLKAKLEVAEQDIDDLEGVVGDANSGLVKDVATNTQNIGTNTAAIGQASVKDDQGNVTSAATGLHALIEANDADINANTTAITNEIARAKAAEEANTKAIGDLRKEVMEDIQTADAMVFKDVVATEAELIAKEATAQIGHTYKASDEFTLTQGDSVISVHIGDLLIATGTENAETGIIADVVWKHVPSGYVADYNPKIEAAEDTEGDNEVILALSSGVAKDESDLANRGDLGKITLATAEGSALTVSTNNAGKVTFGMVWQSFDPNE